MDVERKRIEEDLRGQVAGEVRCDDFFVQLYATDASIYELPPLGVVRPRSVDDVVATVRYAAENKIPLRPRGAGSGLAGESLGRGLVVDFSRFMRRVISIDEQTVRVQAGLVLERLNTQLAPLGRLFGPDPATSRVSTLGGIVSVDGSGSHWPVYGSARSRVRSLEVVLASGDVVELSTHEIPQADATGPVNRLALGLENILTKHRAKITAHQPQSLINRCGYQLADLREDKRLYLAKLLGGSEGTLGLITELTLETATLPKCVGSALLFFETLEKAALASLELAPLRPSACDLMDRRHLSLARESDPRYEFLIPQAAEAVLLVEHHAESPAELADRLQQTVEIAQHRSKLASGAYVAADAFDHEMLWQLARQYVPTLYRLKGSSRPVPVVEDIALPPTAVPEFLFRMQETLKNHQVTASLFAHVGHGQLHVRPLLDLTDTDDLRRMEALVDELYPHVWDLGGTISGEHGDGLSRTPFVEDQYGELVGVFEEVKELFDPQWILNPGKKVPLEDWGVSDNLRHLGVVPTAEENVAPEPALNGVATGQLVQIELQLDWSIEQMAYEARTCNGCAACRAQAVDVRMCPIFRYAPREEASPRAKANLVRGLLNGSLPSGSAVEDACRAIADLCVHCQMCRLECPAEVDIPKLMVEAKAAYVATNGERLHDWLLARVELLCATAVRVPRLANWAIRNRIARWIIEKTMGIAQGRKLPRFNAKPFLQQAIERKLHRPQKSNVEKVVYFVDTYANYCDAELAQALLAVLEHNGVSVYVPLSQRQAGMPMIVRGVLGPARAVAELNVALLAEAVRQGYTVVATEPSAVLALTRDYLSLLPGDDDARLVAENSFEACHYLWKSHQRGKLQLDFEPLPITIGYHTPCHTKALGFGSPAERLLNLVPSLKVERLEKGCSGIAGLYGFQRTNYRRSLRAGLPLLTAVRTGTFQLGATECSTCRIQMEQGATKRTIHPIKLLALAYGLMPELRDRLFSPAEELVVS